MAVAGSARALVVELVRRARVQSPIAKVADDELGAHSRYVGRRIGQAPAWTTDSLLDARARFRSVAVLGAARECRALWSEPRQGRFLFGFFWVLSRLIEAWGKRLITSRWARGCAVSGSLITLGVRAGKIAVLLIAVVALVSAMGYPATSLIAGLGVGGLAVALAAQKTLEHLFGAFAIGADPPFREGDFIKLDDFAGTVEVIGLRSTRVRTLQGTVIAIPNGKLSETRVENFAARDKLLLTCKTGLVYETTAAQMHQVLRGFEALLNAHPKVSPIPTVRFTEFGTSSLTVEVMA